MKTLLLLAAFLACDDHRGELGQPCKPDGTCIGSNLECAGASDWLGTPLFDALCRVKEKKP